MMLFNILLVCNSSSLIIVGDCQNELSNNEHKLVINKIDIMRLFTEH